jgi:hypothetical protein
MNINLLIKVLSVGDLFEDYEVIEYSNGNHKLTLRKKQIIEVLVK